MNDDRTYMGQALDLAAKGFGTTAPNPMVGCVIVKNGSVLGTGWHRRCGGPHAEVYALQEAGSKARGAVLYVTLEPCSHMGKTPPCAEAIIRAGVGRVVAAMRDPNPLVGGKGLAFLRKNGVAVKTGVMRTDAACLNELFIHEITGRPFVTLKTAQTLDGRIADAAGKSQWITGPDARRQVHRMRGMHQAVIAGSGTVLADDPELTARIPGARNPLRIIMDGRLRVKETARVVRNTDGKTIIATLPGSSAVKKKRLEKKGVRLWEIPAGRDGRISLKKMIGRASQEGIFTLFVEGGREIHSAFLKERAADKMHIFYAPKILGEGPAGTGPCGVTGLDNALTLTNVIQSRFGDDVLISGYLNRK